MAVRRHLFLIYKELLHNIARHARATAVTIRLDHADGLLTLTVQDDGVGFDPATTTAGTGLGSLRERAAAIGATLAIESTPGRGTRVRVAVPLGRPPLPMRWWTKRRERVMRRPADAPYADPE